MIRAVLLAAALIPVVATTADTTSGPGDRGACRLGKLIERALGEDGFRVVAGGGFAQSDAVPVKLQVWASHDRDWVITERFMGENRTCVVRTGRSWHVLYGS